KHQPVRGKTPGLNRRMRLPDLRGRLTPVGDSDHVSRTLLSRRPWRARDDFDAPADRGVAAGDEATRGRGPLGPLRAGRIAGKHSLRAQHFAARLHTPSQMDTHHYLPVSPM